MRIILKHLMLPFTALLWYLVCFYAIYGVVTGLAYIFDLNWLWLLFFEFIFIGLISTLFTVPSLGNNYLLSKFYNYSWVSVVLHSVAGGFGFFRIMEVFYEKGIGIGMFWDISPFKTVLLFFPALGVFLGIVYSIIINPFLIKIEKPRS